MSPDDAARPGRHHGCVTTVPGPRRVSRSTSQRWVGGVAGGLAEHFGVPVAAIRVAFVVATLAGGLGLVAYALMWVFLPLQPADAASPSRPGEPGWDITGLLGLVALGLGLLLALAALGVPVRVSAWGPILLFGTGVAVLWRQSDEAQRGYLTQRAQVGVAATANATDRAMWLRVLVGLGLVAIGFVAAIGPRVDLWTGLRGLAAAGAVVAGLALIALPWVSALIARAQAERFAAVRNEERAAMAARVHDSVLQTLTLIQRRAGDEAEVRRLARAEERALRSWLYAPQAPSGTLAGALAQVVADCEADYDTRVELVTVGDIGIDARVAELLAATREAIVNAAKHSGSTVSVYCEVSEDQVEVNVKDRGSGFEVDAIPADRHGVRESVIARVSATGGAALVRSAPGEGTEVRLTLPVGRQLGGRDA